MKETLTTGTIKTDTFEMDFFRFGRGERPFVIIPGLSVQSIMLSAEAVADAYKDIAEHYTVYVFDRRKKLPARYSVADMARDTAAAMKGLGLDNSCIFGASQGGMIAMLIAANNPDLAEKLVLGSTSACVSEADFEIFEEWISFAKAKDARGLYMAFGKAAYPEEVFNASQELLAGMAKTVTGKDLRRFIVIAEGMRGFDALARLKDIKCPVLFIGDSTDKVFGPKAAEQISKGFKDRPDFEFHMYSGYGHAAYDTAPDYKQRILSFLKS